MKFISQRCINVNRGGSSEEKKPKRAKLKKKQGKHQYLMILNQLSLMKYLLNGISKNFLLKCRKRSNPNSDILDSLMMQIFANRRKSILECRIIVSEICDKIHY